jgi:protein TonB
MNLTMSRRSTLLFPTALGISAAAHLLLLFLWPYSPARPAQQPPEPIPVRLVEAPRPIPKPAPRPQAVPPATQSLAPEQAPAPAAQPVVPPAAVPPAEPEPQPAVPQEPLELAPPEPASGLAPQEAAGQETAAAASPAGSGSGASAELAAEIAATQAVLSSLRGRIVEKIRYPALARANGWKGTVLLELVLDETGALQGLAVRRSSGYAVLDRAASALVRSVTPVDNPLGRPLCIEVPIAYELKD